jgi:hypothetical protein
LLALGLIPLGLVRSATTLAVVRKTGRSVVLMGAEGLGGFVVVAIVLVPMFGSIGASVAVLAAFVVAGLRAWHRMGLGPILARARFGRVVASGGLVALFLVPSVSALALGTLASALYLGTLFAVRALDVAELRSAARYLSPRPHQTRSDRGFFLDD